MSGLSVRRMLVIALLGVSLFAMACFGVGEVLSHPAASVIGGPPPDLPATSEVFSTSGNETVSGWFIRGAARQGAVLLLHGVRSDRRSMVERARLLSRHGYAVLLIDLPAHGESSGGRITFGLREAIGVKAALNFLRTELPGSPVGVIGVALGAASIVLAKANPPPNAVVLESMYPTIAEAVTDRIARWLGPAAKAIAPLLLRQLPLRLGISANELRPIVDIPALHASVLVASGTLDQHTTLDESRRIFDAAVEPKAFWAVDGAGHVDLYAFAPLAYESKILPFLSKYLKSGA